MSPPAIVAVFQPGGHESGAAAPSSRQPFSRSIASSRASDSGEPGTGQIVPAAVGPPTWRPLIESSMSPAVAITSLRIRLLETALRNQLVGRPFRVAPARLRHG